MVPRGPRTRAFWITLLDAALVLCASAAIVILLGGRVRFLVAGVLVSIRSAANPMVVAAVIMALRLWLGRGLRPLPAIRILDHERFEEERARFAQPPDPPRGFAWYALAAVLASIAWLAPHLANLRGVPDVGDPVFSAWRLARVAHQLANDPRHLFDGNIFHPTADTLAYSDATLLQGVIAAPFVLAGADPLAVSNAIIVLGFPFSALAFFYFGWRLTHDPRAACVIGILGSTGPLRFDQYSHIEMQLSGFIPLAFIALLDAIAAPSRRNGLVLGSLVAAQWFAGMYLGVMLLAWCAPIGGAALLAWARRPWRPLVEALAIAGLVIAVAFGALARPYLRAQAAHGEWNAEVIESFSAEGGDYRQPSPRTWMSRFADGAGKHERRLFPGAVTAGLGAAGLVPPLGAAGIAAAIGGTAAVDWSLGLHGLTYDDLQRRVAAFRGMRAPARFGVFAGISLLALAALGLHRVLRAADRRHAGTAVTAALAVLALLVDGRPSIPLAVYPSGVPGIYDSVTPSMVLAEFPVTDDNDIAFMYFSTRHWARLVNGYSGFFPEPYIRYRDDVSTFPSPAAVDAARRAGATHITFNCALEPRKYRCPRTFEALDANPRLEPAAAATWRGEDVRLYRVKD